MTLELLLRAAGASLVALALVHAALWRHLRWGEERGRLSPLNARVFAVHVFFIAFVLAALGALSLARPDLLLARSELARALLSATVLFWIVRLAIQPFVFDPVMPAPLRGLPARLLVSAVWAGYVAIYGLALMRRLGAAR